LPGHSRLFRVNRFAGFDWVAGFDPLPVFAVPAAAVKPARDLTARFPESSFPEMASDRVETVAARLVGSLVSPAIRRHHDRAPRRLGEH
jgi:hypothetical protein